MKNFWILIPAIALLSSPTSAMYRQWNDLEGKFSIEAEYIAYKDGKIYLEKRDGAALSFPVDKLSRADREYLRTLSSTEERELFEYLEKNPLKYDNVVFVTTELPRECWSLAFSPNGSLLAVGTGHGLHIVDLKTSKFVTSITEFKPKNTVYFCRFSPDGKRLITGHPLGAVKVWTADDQGSLTLEKEYKENGSLYLTSLDFSANGKRMVATDGLSTRYWDFETATDMETLPNLHSIKPRSCVINAEGTQALVADGRKLVKYELETTRVTEWMTLSDGRLPTPAISPDGKYVAVSDFDGLRLWTPFRSEELITLEDYILATKFAFSPDGKYLLVACSSDLRLWSVQNKTLVQSYRYIAGRQSNAIAFSADSQYFAASTGDGGRTVQVFRIPGPTK